jgi:predicted anti-sigma-YlaC factor YlaD
MKCDEVYQWLQAYLDTEVTAVEERMVEKHIRSCLVCRRKLVELAQTVNKLQQSDKLTPRQDFTKRLMERLEQEIKERG